MTNCPNCGAPITGRICEYCGTVHWQDSSFEESADPAPQKSAEIVIETVDHGKRVPVAIILKMSDSLFSDPYDEVECRSFDGTYMRYTPPEKVIFSFTVLQTDGTLRLLVKLVNKCMEYYVVLRDKESKRAIVEYRVIGRLSFTGLGTNDGEVDIVITAEWPVDSHWKAV